MTSPMATRPDRTAKLLGTVRLDPCSPVTAGQFGTWMLTYTVGAYGIDEGGTIKLAYRFASDWQAPQFDRPSEAGFTTVTTTGQAKLRVRYDRKGHHRPWMKCIVIDVYDGSLAPGETVTIVLGDRRGGSPGIRAQSFQESSHVFQVFVDPTNACQAQPVPDCPVVQVVADQPTSLVLTLPAQTKVGDPVPIHLRGQDRWSNPTTPPSGVTLRWQGDAAGQVLDNTLVVHAEGWGRVIATWSGKDYASHPIRIFRDEPALKHYWGDLHAQTDATVGTGSEEEYFTFARDVARLDFTSHQGNDFQMTDADWQRLNDAVRRFHQDGRFVVFPGYEWSANTSAGGDRNVFYLEEGMPILRSSAWQIGADEAVDLSAHMPVDVFFQRLRATVDPDKVLCGAHVGGRYADIRRGFDEELGPLIEVVSCWGVFEWLLHDAIELGYVFGVMANSDGHKGRPGAEGPGAGEFGIAGGLTCVLAENLSRRAIFTALKQRRCYGTTGARIHLDFTINGQPMGAVLAADGKTLRVQARVLGAGPVERLQLYRGHSLFHEVASPELEQTGQSPCIRLTWGGSRMRGRGRRVTWDGTLRCEGNRILSATPYGFDSPTDGVTSATASAVCFRSRTTGDADGLDLLLEDAARGTLTFDSPVQTCVIDLARLNNTPKTWELGGLDLRLSARRYPQTIEALSLEMDLSVPVPSGPREPWFVKAIQADGQMAWSSPIFIGAHKPR